jgi:hypothetical protein
LRAEQWLPEARLARVALRLIFYKVVQRRSCPRLVPVIESRAESPQARRQA